MIPASQLPTPPPPKPPVYLIWKEIPPKQVTGLYVFTYTNKLLFTLRDESTVKSDKSCVYHHKEICWFLNCDDKKKWWLVTCSSEPVKGFSCHLRYTSRVVKIASTGLPSCHYARTELKGANTKIPALNKVPYASEWSHSGCSIAYMQEVCHVRFIHQLINVQHVRHTTVVGG